MSKLNRICLCIIIGLSISGVLGSSILFFVDIPKSTLNVISTWSGIAGTAFSVILSIIAMFYSNKSSKDSEISLKKITDHYETLCKELSSQEIQKSIGINSIERVLRNNQPNPNDNKHKS